MLKRIAIYSKVSNSKTAEGVLRLMKEFCKRGIEIQVCHDAGDSFSMQDNVMVKRFAELNELKELPDLVLSVGGDGTFLETMLKVRAFGIPVAGVNTGRMGFLANISEEDIGHSVDLLCQGKFEVIERYLLEIVYPAGLFRNGSQFALNEITIQKSDPRMITVNVYVGTTYLNTYWADGLIISTATGSTAYNLSVGGPILSPEDKSIIISPISPHNLTIRPIILSGDGVLRLEIEGRVKEYICTCDFRSIRLPFSENVLIARSPDKLKTVMLDGNDFYSTLRSKLMWGADKRN